MVIVRSKNADSKLSYDKIDDDGSFQSEIAIPDGRDPNQNAMLTITLGYSLNFADRNNPVAGVIVQQGGKFFARDFDNKLHPIVDWDFNSQIKFHRAFRRGEDIWNWQFVLITPQDYDGLDFESMAGPGWVCRPNILCLFRLKSGGSHLTINVVRLDPSITSAPFRSHKNLYDYLDVWSPTLGHELGHALGMGHIKELLNDALCIADAWRGIYPDRCYGETPSEKANIMGSGDRRSPLNAKPWLERIAEHTGRQQSQWQVTGVMGPYMGTPPRRIPLGVSLVGKPQVF